MPLSMRRTNKIIISNTNDPVQPFPSYCITSTTACHLLSPPLNKAFGLVQGATAGTAKQSVSESPVSPNRIKGVVSVCLHRVC